LRLAREALHKGGAWPCALNAADEVAIASFLDRRIPFTGIAQVIERVLERTQSVRFKKMEDVLAADTEARRMAREEAERISIRWPRRLEILLEGKNSPMSTLIGIILVLGTMILVHEIGHFIAAKLFGVRVEVFSVGFPPRLWGSPGRHRLPHQRDPSGGYVKMAGDNISEERSGAPTSF